MIYYICPGIREIYSFFWMTTRICILDCIHFVKTNCNLVNIEYRIWRICQNRTKYKLRSDKMKFKIFDIHLICWKHKWFLRIYIQYSFFYTLQLHIKMVYFSLWAVYCIWTLLILDFIVSYRFHSCTIDV